MSLARVTVWTAGQVLTAAALDAEFDNILNNPGPLISPITANLDFGNFQAVRMRLENVTTTQSPAQIGRAMFNSSADTIDIDDGSFIRHVPGVKSSQATSTGAVSINDGTLAKAWVVFNGQVSSSQITAAAAYGVSTSANAVIRNSTGIYSVNWLNQFPTAGYSINAAAGGSTTAAYTYVQAVSTAGVTIQVTASSGPIDVTYVSIQAFGVSV